MIIAPDVFTIDQGTYTPEIAVDWFADPRLGTPTPLFIGRTLRYSDADGWEVGPATAGVAWKSMPQAPKAVKTAFEQVDTQGLTEGYYELVGPKLAGNPHDLDDVALIRHGDLAFTIPIDDIPRTSLYAWPAWLEKAGVKGVLWTDNSGEETRHAVVNGQHLP